MRSAVAVLLLVQVLHGGAQQAQSSASTARFEIAFPTPSPADAPYYRSMPEEVQQRFRAALDRLNAVWASEQFRTKITTRTYHHYGSNDDADAAVVFKTITDPLPKRLTYYLCLGTADAYATTDQIEESTCVYQSYLDGEGQSLNALVNTMAHEWTHTKTGGMYTHPRFDRSWRPDTVPYAVGNLSEDLADQMFPARSIGAQRAGVLAVPQGTHFSDVVVRQRSKAR